MALPSGVSIAREPPQPTALDALPDSPLGLQRSRRVEEGPGRLEWTNFPHASLFPSQELHGRVRDLSHVST